MTQGIQAARNGSRPLTESDRESALDLLENGLLETPMYQWLLGADAPSEAYRWYGEVLVAENLHGLRGVFDESGALIALIALAYPTRPAGRVDDELMARIRHFVGALDGFPDRFTELRRSQKEAATDDRAIEILFALVHPDRRRGGTLAGLLDEVIGMGRRDDLPVVAGTADATMSEVYVRRWDAPVRGEFTLTGGPTVWIHRIAPPGERR
ncbi:hypothetical protein [Gordonia alkanivorans]|uniref:hypothetical protein n=1 Tax=Gordonia alkanivorans TaxID=84096 RepID=UPI0004B63BC7|nr:hypothetical protein [Gordonia alkanivorans]